MGAISTPIMAGTARIWNQEEEEEEEEEEEGEKEEGKKGEGEEEEEQEGERNDTIGGGLVCDHLAYRYYKCLAVSKASGQPAGRGQSCLLTSLLAHAVCAPEIPPVGDESSQEGPCCPPKEHHETGLEAIVGRAHAVLHHKEGGQPRPQGIPSNVPHGPCHHQHPECA